MTPIQEVLGANIVKLRKKATWEQEDLAEKLGVSALTVYRWETGRSWPSPKDIEALAGVFDVETWSLFKASGPVASTLKKKARRDVDAALALIRRELGL